MNKPLVSHPDHSSGPGCSQRPHVAPVYTFHASPSINVGFVYPSVSSNPSNQPTIRAHAFSRRVSSVTISRRRARRCEVNECRLCHHYRPARRSKVGIHSGEIGSFEGARSEHNAESKVEILRRYVSMANVHNSRVPVSPKSMARRKLNSGCSNNSPSITAGRRPTGIQKHRAQCAPSSPPPQVNVRDRERNQAQQ